jgi:hypothetical protein
VKSRVDYFENGLGGNDNVGNKGLELLDSYGHRRFLAFFHFQEPDHAGHAHGENSSEYTAMIVDDDRWLGRLIDKLRELGVEKKTYVFVIVDHGFDEGQTSHSNAPYVILGSNHPDVMRAGDRRDVAPTILEVFDVPDGQDGTPPLSGAPLTKRRSKTCIAEGGTVIDDPGEPGVCPGLTVVGLARERQAGGSFSCLAATGGTGDRSGYASACGDGACRAPENRCNCPRDCIG